MHWFGASMQTPISLTMWSFARSRIYTEQRHQQQGAGALQAGV